MKIGDLVYLPCRIVGMGNMAYTGEAIVDLIPERYTSTTTRIDSASYPIKTISVFAKDVKQKESE